ncbi:3-hydroxyacyl-CoA dehydrogenase [Prauserella flavalba]|uniref:3-hydroxyacyl-CoA dehydrogenase n=1 Tax=Prauserella flavalba TaxID=1477506 RepID=A0A318LFJ5_9PSEU|nr:3-hydroxyacyl-CoA dehydrogenase [Prauserella flavalba]PXY21546.1 3-hydroxyacyl-CoA dehydrogenase [Prauserella flavalba]
MSPPAVAVAGAGSIGAGFALTFARGGFRVRLWDPDTAAVDRALEVIADRLGSLHRHGLLDADPGDVAGRIDSYADLGGAVAGCSLVQECTPERAEVKQSVFAELAGLTGPGTVLASSSSAMVPSDYGGGDPRVLGAHPGNPPYLLPVIELVPSPNTDRAVLDRARDLYAKAGLRPVLVRREVEGFVFNRLQGALLREAYCLLRDGVADVADIDEVVRSGLGLRWSVIGPFETADLNTRGGIAAHARLLGPAYARMGADRGQHDPWTPELVQLAERQRRALLPLEQWEDRVRWRDEQLMRRHHK